MKKFRQLLCAALLGVLCLCMSGCGKMTVEKLIPKMDEALAGKTVSSCDMLMDMETALGMNVMGMDMSLDMILSMDMEILSSEDPVKSYIDGTVHMEMLEQSVDTDLQVYTEENGDVLSTYSYSSTDDSWTYEEEEFDREEYKAMSALSKLPMEDRFSDMVLEEETTELNGKEVYVLHITCTGDDMNALMDQFGDSMLSSTDSADLSFEGLVIPAIYYVDTETFLPVQIDIDLEGMDEMLNNLLKEEMANLGSGEKSLRGMEETTGIDPSMLGDVEVSFEGFQLHMTMDNISYEPQEVPSVPEDVKESLTFDSVLEDVGISIDDRTYVLKNDELALKVIIPEDYSDMESDEEALSFCKGEESAYISYTLISEEDVSLFDEEYALYFGDSYETENVLTDLGVASVYWLEDEGYNLISAYVLIDSYAVFVNVMDFENNWADAEAAMAEVMSCVSELTYEDLK